VQTTLLNSKKSAEKSPKKILVLGPAWVGDMVLAHSLFSTLKAQNPDCQIDVAAPAWTLPLLDRMPEVTNSIALPFKHGEFAFWQRVRFGKSLRKAAYTQAIILTNSLKSAILPFAANIPRRTGFLGEMRYGLINDIRPLDKTKLPRTVDRFVTLGLAQNTELPSDLPNPKLLANHENALATLAKIAHAKPSQKVLGLCPGAEYGEAKRWPIEYYAQAAKAALAQGWEVWLFGSEKDLPYTEQINQGTAKRCLDLGGKTKLGEAIDLMALCDTVISNDSGLMHVAAALDKNLIAIFGSSTPHHTPPMSDKSHIKYLGLACSPCFKRVCPLSSEQEHMQCLKKITPESVIKLI
jgi:heptosyltransferase-2